MSNEFMREERYIVFKMSDLGNSLKGDEIRRLAREYAEHRQRLRKKPLECVVVEKDWPEYEPTWQAIEARANGAQPAPTIAEQDQINAEAAIRSIYGAQPAPIEMSITTGALSEMFLSLDGHDNAQPGYEWRKGWNDAIRQAMDYAQPAQSVPDGWQLVPTAESRHPGIYKMLGALHAADNTPGMSEWESYRAALAAAPEAKPTPSVPDATWLPVPDKHPTFDPVDLQLADGSVLCGCVPQSDGDYWWKGPSGEVFIDPRYAPATHWRLSAAPESKP